MIELKTDPNHRIVELGGGDRPRARPNVDCRPGPSVDVVADFNEPLPFEDGEFDGAFSQYALEHVSWRNVRAFLKEVCRIIKPGGKAAFVVPDTEEQMKWVLSRGWERRPPRDGMAAFEEASCVLFGDLDYPENSHKAFFSPDLIKELLKTAGFAQVHVTPYGECGTDMVVEAVKAPEPPPPTLKETNVRLSRREQGLEEEYARKAQQDVLARERNFRPNVLGTNVDRKLPDEIALIEKVTEAAGKKLESAVRDIPLKDLKTIQVVEGGKVVSETSVGGKAPEEKLKIVQEAVSAGKAEDRAPLFDRAYFNGGGKVGGYAREGYWDYPVHEVTARHVLARKPESVLEVGVARGYVLKRIQDAGIPAAGLEISKHCYMTRVCNAVRLHDLCQTPWGALFQLRLEVDEKDEKFDLCFSIATLEHVPEEHLPAVIREMARTCKRGLHGIDFGHKDDGFDKTHCTLKPKEWWAEQFATHAPGWPVEILDKEELERGDFPKDVLEGDGRLKVNVGSFTTMFHHGWVNIDQHDLVGWAQGHGYRFHKCDVRQGLPFGTGAVDLVYAGHFLNQLTYKEATAFLRDCRRVIRPDGALRFIVPDARLLMCSYAKSQQHPVSDLNDFEHGHADLWDFDEVNENCAAAPTAAEKLWSLLHDGHQSCWDAETLLAALDGAGFHANDVGFRGTKGGGGAQLLRETLDTLPCLSLYVEAHPRIG